MTELRYLYWYVCAGCGYETVAHGRVACPECNDPMNADEVAGAFVDKRTADKNQNSDQ